MRVGHWVVCVDKDEERVAVLGGRTPIYEPGLENLVTRSVRQGRFFFSTELAEVVHEVATLFIAVDTPQGDDEAADLSSVGALAGAVMWWAGLLILGSGVYAESGSGWAVLLTALLALATSGALRLLCEQGVEWVYSRDSFRIPTLVIGGEGGPGAPGTVFRLFTRRLQAPRRVRPLGWKGGPAAPARDARRNGGV